MEFSCKKNLIIGTFILLILLVGCRSQNENTLNVYNWGEYIDKEVLSDFKKETGITVKYDNFVTNEDLYVKLKRAGSSFDLIVPSEYMIEKMAKEDLLLKIDKEKLENISNINPKIQSMADQRVDGYSVPYFWGTLGIVYNKNLVDEPVDSWDILWDEKYSGSIIMLDSSRDSIGIALKKLGYSLNSTDIKELKEAENLLIKQKPIVMAYLVDETKSYMVSEEAALGVMYSGDAYDAILENENLAYVIPKEGSNLWVDSMAIPKNAKNVENAYKFIDFILNPEVGAQISDWVGYSTPNKEAEKLLPEEMKDSEVAFPDLEEYDLEIFFDPGKDIVLYDSIWTNVIAE